MGIVVAIIVIIIRMSIDITIIIPITSTVRLTYKNTYNKKSRDSNYISYFVLRLLQIEVENLIRIISIKRESLAQPHGFIIVRAGCTSAFVFILIFRI